MTCKTLLAAFAAASMSAFPVSGEDRLPGKSSFDIDTENLYELFRDPARQYRPYARWWWNGLRLDENEILRELDIMKEMGLGGVENGTVFTVSRDEILRRVDPPIMSRNSDPAKELMYIRLMPPSNITTKQDTTATLGPRPSSSGRLMSGRTRIRGKVMSVSPTISGWTPLRTCRPR